MKNLDAFLDSLSMRTKIYIALRYGINPWGVCMRQKEIADFLNITPTSLNVLRDRFNERVRTNDVHELFEELTKENLTHPLIAAHKRRKHREKLAHLAYVSRHPQT